MPGRPRAEDTHGCHFPGDPIDQNASPLSMVLRAESPRPDGVGWGFQNMLSPPRPVEDGALDSQPQATGDRKALLLK